MGSCWQNWGPCTGTWSQGRDCLRCPPVTLALQMSLFLVQDPKRFIAINYPNGEAVSIKPILQMRIRAPGEVNDTPGAGQGWSEVVSPCPPSTLQF